MLKRLLRLLTPGSARRVPAERSPVAREPVARAPAARAPVARAPAARAPAAPVPKPPASGPFSAVSLNPGPRGCAAARELGTRRHLRAEAPRLPLPDCTAEQCDCRYRHHADRRGKPRRRSDTFGMHGNFGGTERRTRSAGRRSSDA